MADVSNRNRQPEGQSIGGQFDNERHSESSIELGAHTPPGASLDPRVDTANAFLAGLAGGECLEELDRYAQEIVEEDGWSRPGDLTTIAVAVTTEHGGNPALLRDHLHNTYLGVDIEARQGASQDIADSLVIHGVNHAMITPSEQAPDDPTRFVISDTLMGSVETRQNPDGTFDLIDKDGNPGEGESKLQGVALLDALDRRQDARILSRMTGFPIDRFTSRGGPLLDSETGVMTVPVSSAPDSPRVIVEDERVSPRDGIGLDQILPEDRDQDLLDMRRALILADTRNPARAHIAQAEFSGETGDQFYSSAQAQAAMNEIKHVADGIGAVGAQWEPTRVTFRDIEGRLMGAIMENGRHSFVNPGVRDAVQPYGVLVERRYWYEERTHPRIGREEDRGEAEVPGAALPQDA